MTRRQTCGELPPAAKRTPYCSVCNELDDVPHDDMWEKAVDNIFDRLDRLTRVRTLYHRRHRRW